MAEILQRVWTEMPGQVRRSWDILRLDRLHPSVNGNKPFKLHGYLSHALDAGFKGILTFGGPYSNHIHASAHAAHSVGLKSIGIIRGERPDRLSPTLSDAESQGMELRFMDRGHYRAFADACTRDGHSDQCPAYLPIPEGGAGFMGMEGAALIHRWIPKGHYDAILCACGTGTTMAGLAKGAEKGQRIVGVSVLKGYMKLESDVRGMAGPIPEGVDLDFIHEHHYGGYAKADGGLTDFMNGFHDRHGIPSDFVYTGKLFHAAEDLMRKGCFRAQERILCIHSGGLQGNRSLPEGTLRFDCGHGPIFAALNP